MFAANILGGLWPVFPINLFLAVSDAFACAQGKCRRFQLFQIKRLRRNILGQIMLENMRQGLLTERASAINWAHSTESNLLNIAPRITGAL